MHRYQRWIGLVAFVPVGVAHADHHWQYVVVEVGQVQERELESMGRAVGPGDEERYPASKRDRSEQRKPPSGLLAAFLLCAEHRRILVTAF